jgi:hypothetical protein
MQHIHTHTHSYVLYLFGPFPRLCIKIFLPCLNLGRTVETVLFVAVVLQADIFSISDKSLCALLWCAVASGVSLVGRLERNWGDKRIWGMNLYFSVTSVVCCHGCCAFALWFGWRTGVLQWCRGLCTCTHFCTAWNTEKYHEVWALDYHVWVRLIESGICRERGGGAIVVGVVWIW